MYQNTNPDFMDDLQREANNSVNYDVTDFIRSGTPVEVPICPSHGDYLITFNTLTGELQMTCTMTVHNLPAAGEVTE